MREIITNGDVFKIAVKYSLILLELEKWTNRNQELTQ